MSVEASVFRNTMKGVFCSFRKFRRKKLILLWILASCLFHVYLQSLSLTYCLVFMLHCLGLISSPVSFSLGVPFIQNSSWLHSLTREKSYAARTSIKCLLNWLLRKVAADVFSFQVWRMPFLWLPSKVLNMFIYLFTVYSMTLLATNIIKSIVKMLLCN
jgi:hypothetical protein